MDTISLKIDFRPTLVADIIIHNFKNFERMNFSIVDLIDEVPALKRVRQSTLFINMRDNDAGHADICAPSPCQVGQM